MERILIRLEPTDGASTNDPTDGASTNKTEAYIMAMVLTTLGLTVEVRSESGCLVTSLMVLRTTGCR